MGWVCLARFISDVLGCDGGGLEVELMFVDFVAGGFLGKAGCLMGSSCWLESCCLVWLSLTLRNAQNLEPLEDIIQTVFDILASIR